MFIDTVNILLTNLIGWRIKSYILYIIVFIYISWEILLAILLLKYIKKIQVIILIFLNNIFLTIISHYLLNMNRLNLCGCFGKYSNFFYPKHFMILYIINIVLIFYFIVMLLCYARFDE